MRLHAFVVRLPYAQCSFLLLLTFLFSLVSVDLKANDDNPVVINDLRGVECFAQPDKLVTCGAADTIPILLATKSTAPIQDLILNLDFGDGLEFADFAFVESGNANLDTINVSNAESPSFLIDELSAANGGVVVYVGVRASCSFVEGSDPSVNAGVEFLADGQSCEAGLDLTGLGSNVFIPVLEFGGAISNTGSFGGPFPNERCLNIPITNTAPCGDLRELSLLVSNFGADLGVMFTTANQGIATLNPDSTVSIVIDGGVDPTALGGDGVLAPGEIVNVQVCFSIDECIPLDGIEPNVVIESSCGGESCGGTPMTASGVIGTFFNFGTAVELDAQIIQESALCDPATGAPQPLIFEVAINTSNMSVPEGNIWDLNYTASFCNPALLAIDTAFFIDGPGGAFLAGIPNITQSSVSGNINANFSAFDPGVDIDGAGPLQDLDGDGVFDDLEAGDIVYFRYHLLPGGCSSDGGLSCPSPVTADGEDFNCAITSHNVTGIVNCGRNSSSASDTSEEIIIENSMNSSVFNGTEDFNLDGQDLTGYDFGQFGLNANTGAPLPPASVVFDLSYMVTDPSECPTPGDITYIVEFSGDASGVIQNFEFSNFTYTGGGGGPTLVSNVFMNGRRTIVIDPGSADAAMSQAFTFEITADTAICLPPRPITASVFVVEECDGCECNANVTCNSVPLRVDPENVDCVGPFEVTTAVERISTGYNDRTLSTPIPESVAIQDDLDVSDRDVTLALPGDTIRVCTNVTVSDAALLNIINYNLFFDLRLVDSLGGSTNLSTSEIEYLESRIESFSLNRPDGSIVDLGQYCATWDPGPGFRPFSDADNRNNGWQFGANLNSRFRECIEHSGLKDMGALINSNIPAVDFFSIRDNRIWVFNFGGAPRGENTSLITGLRDFVGGYQDGDVFEICYRMPVISAPEVYPDGSPHSTSLMEQRFRANIAGDVGSPPNARGGRLLTGISVGTDGYTFWEPELMSEARMEVSEDECSAELVHVLRIANPPPADWYPSEFRPIIGIEDLEISIPGGWSYSGGANFTHFDQPTVFMEPNTTEDMIAEVIAGTQVFFPCEASGRLVFIDSESINGTSGDSYDFCNDFPFDEKLSGGTFPLLGVGMGQIDSLVFRIPIDRVCGTEPMGIPLFNQVNATYATIPSYIDAGFTNNFSGASGNHRPDFPMMPGEYWPYDRDNDDNPHHVTNDEMVLVDIPAITSVTPGLMFTSASSFNDGAGGEISDLELTLSDAADNVVLSICVDPSVDLVSVGGVPATSVGVFNGRNCFTVDLGSQPAGTQTIPVETDLIFCDQAGIFAEVLFGCPDPDGNLSALLAATGKSCSDARDSVNYIAGAPDAQFVWTVPPITCGQTSDDFTLTITNTGTSDLMNPTAVIHVPGGSNNPTGMVLSDFMVNGTTVSGATDASIPSCGLGDPLAINVAEAVPTIAPGESITVTFNATTGCDYTIGSTLFAALSADAACNEAFDSPKVESPRGPDAPSPSFSVSPSSMTLSCGEGGATVVFTSVNAGKEAIGQTQACFTLPAGIGLTADNINVVAPDGFDPNPVESTPIGAAGDMEVCFDGPSDLPIGGVFCVEVMFDADAACGPVNIGFSINSLMDLDCGGMTCMPAATSLGGGNFTFEIVPATGAAEMEVVAACSDTPGQLDIEYTVTFENNGAAYVDEPAEIAVYFDVDQDGEVDAFDNLLGMTTTLVSADSSSTAMFTESISVPEEMACQLVFELTAGDCACSTLELSPEIQPEVLAAIGDNLIVCPGDKPVMVGEVCGDFFAEFIPPTDGTVTVIGDSVEIAMDPAIQMSQIRLVSTLGSCTFSDTIPINRLPDLEFGPYEFTICEGLCQTFDFGFSVAESADVEVMIEPSTFLTDPTSIEPEFCDAIPGTYMYDVTFLFAGCCTAETTITLTVEEAPEIELKQHKEFCATDEIDLSSLLLEQTPSDALGTWSTTTGDGTFVDDTGTPMMEINSDMTGFYIPGPGDIAAGEVDLDFVQETPQGVCLGARSQAKVILFFDPPAIICPADIVSSNSPGWCGVTFPLPTVPVTDDCAELSSIVTEISEDGGVTWIDITTIPADRVWPIGTTDFLIRAVEPDVTIFDGTAVITEDMFSDTCEFSITVEDKIAPELICSNTTLVLDGSMCSGSVDIADLATATDECMVASLLSADGGMTVDLGPFDAPIDTMINITIQATDDAGNVSECISSVRVICGVDPVPSIGLAKRASDVDLLPNGCAEITYEFNIENTGNVQLSDLVLTDDLTTAFSACGSFAIDEITSDDFAVNPNYDGTATSNMLEAGNTFLPGDMGAVLLTVEACGCGTTMIENMANVSGTPPNGGDPVTDDSTDGSAPDPEGDGAGDNMDPTITDLSQNPVIGLAKRATDVDLLPNGCSEVTYEFNIENTGNVQLTGLTLTDDLVTAFSACTSFTIDEITSDDFIVNGGYDGTASSDMLIGQDTLSPRDKGAVLLTVEACGCGDASIMNSASVGATAPDGTGVEDDSNDGSDADPEGDGPGDNMDPTITQLGQNPVIGLAKRVSDIDLLPNGCNEVTYEFNVQNYGNVDLTAVSVTDDLVAAFGGCSSFAVDEITSDDFVVNAGYDGTPGTNMLSGQDTLSAGDKGAILLTVEACGCGSVTIENQAMASGTAPDGSTADDTSDSGSDPDEGGDGPGDDMDPTLTDLSQNPEIGLAKRAASVWLQDDGCALIDYEFNIENTGDVLIDNLMLTDDLATAFAGCAGDVSIKEITSDDFVVNTDYAAVFAGGNMLGANSSQQPGDKGAVLLTIEACGCGNAMIENQAMIAGEAPDGTGVMDASDSGSDPDEGDDGPGDDMDPTITDLSQNPVIGLAKRATDVDLLPNGCSEVTYEFNIENAGNVQLTGLTLTDDLQAAFGACTSFTIDEIISDDFIVNGGYDGTASSDMLIGQDTLSPGDKGAVLLTVEACGCGDASIMNSASVGATAPDGTGVEDDSNNGSDADPEGDGPGDNMDPTITQLGQDPELGLAKRAAKVWLQDDGCALIEYEFNIENSGDVVIDNLLLTDDLSAAFGDCVGDAFIKEVTSDDFVVNTDYAGVFAGDNMLGQSQSIEPGDKGAVLILVEACGCGNITIENMATISGEAPDGMIVEDDSTPGSDPDPNDDGEPDESGITMTDLSQNPVIGLAKRASDVDLLDNGCAELTYEFNIENSGNVQLTGLSLTDDLEAAFAGCASFTIDEITSDDFIVNGAYDGSAGSDMLLGQDTISPGDKGAVLITVEACGCGNAMIENQAMIGATAPDGTVVADDSNDGSDADPEGDGPGDNSDVTITDLSQDPAIGVAKRLVQLVNNGDGSSTATFEFNIQNYGTVDLVDIQLTDDLAAVFAPCSINVQSFTSDDFKINPDYDGDSDIELLLGNDLLEVDDKGAVLLTINIFNCNGNTGPFDNSATATGTPPAGGPISDISTSGSDPDPLGDGDPSDDPEDSIPTTVILEFNSEIGIAKNVVSATPMDDGTVVVTYELNVENFGDQILRNIQVIDDLTGPFGACSSVEVLELTSDDFIVNTSDPYDGLVNIDLLEGQDSLDIGDQGAILLTVQVNCDGMVGPFFNSATVFADGPEGALRDDSQNGSDPDPGPNPDNNPTNNNEDTPVSFEFDPLLGLAKRLASIEMITDDCARVTYEFNIENLGDVDIENLQLIDDLATAFAGCGGDVSIFEITSDDFTVNADYIDAFTSGNLLTGQDDLPVGDLGAVLVTIDACTCGTTEITNSATAEGNDPFGTLVSDVSADGSNPDPNGDGDPSDDPEDSAPTVHTITCTVAIVCPDVHDPVNVQNDQEECGAIVNFPDAQIESNCIGINGMDIQFMLTAVDGSLPVTDPTDGDAIVPYDTWLTGQAGGLNYPVDTITVTYRIDPTDLPTGAPAPILIPQPDGMCSFEVIVRDEQCPVFVTTMPEDTLVLGNMCDIPAPFVINPVWHLRDNCDNPEDILIEFEETKFDSICPNTFTLKRTWLISDVAGNQCEHNHKIFVRDEAPPMLTVPPDVTIEECELDTVIINCRLVFTPIDTVDQLVLIGDDWVITQVVAKDTSEVCDTLFTTVPLTAGIATANDGTCSAEEDIIITFRDSIDLLCKGDKAAVVHRIWRAEDECGNADSLIQEITILDPNPPVLVVPDTVVVSLNADGHVALTRESLQLNVFDACFTDINDIILDVQPGFFNCSEIGFHNVIVAATDPCNNKTAYEEVVVRVVDSQAPVLDCPSGVVDISINPTNCDASFARILDILSGPDCDVTLDTEPSLGPDIDVNTDVITVTATDASGNRSNCAVSVNISLTEDIDYDVVLACNDRVNVSLGNECLVELTPDMILEGSTDICTDLLCIEVEDSNGNDHLNFFDLSDVDQLFRVFVTDCTGSGNSCWSEVLIETKSLPIVAWPQDTTLLCVEPTDPDYFKLGFPELLNCESSYEHDYEDIYSEFGECSNPRAMIERRWLVRDSEGNVVRDTQFISIIPFSTDHVRFPRDRTLEDPVDCSKVTESFFEIENGLIEPTSVLHPDSTGLPDIFGLPLQNDAGLCLFSMGYEDEVLEICGGSFQILRTWTLNDVCGEGDGPISETQIITVYDNVGPEVLDVPELVQVSINPWQCSFSGVLPLPDSIKQSCGDILFEAYITGEGSGFLVVEGTFQAGDLNVLGANIDKGVHWVTYVYKDGCSNIELFKYQIEVVDNIDPTAICSSAITVTLTGNSVDGGVAQLNAEDLDSGSQDSGCGTVESCLVRKVDFDAGNIGVIDGKTAYLAMNGCSIDGERLDTIFDKLGEIDVVVSVPFVFCKEQLNFCCSDLGIQEVVLIVEDESGLTNTCTSNVSVTDMSSNQLTCLPHEIDCTDDKDVNVLEPLGSNSFCGGELSLDFIDDSEFLNDCGEGQIFRIWFIDDNGNDSLDIDEDFCNQVIAVNNDTRFDPFTIKWPKHHTGEVFDGINLECDSDNELQEQPTSVVMGDVFSCSAGEISEIPVWCNTTCGLVGVSAEVDTVEASDACLKLIKRWTVIDWCYWEANGEDVDDENDGEGDQFEAVEDWAQGVCDGCPENVTEGPVYFRYKEVDLDGYYTFDQVIKVVDDSAPSITIDDVVVNTSGGAQSKDDDSICTGIGMIEAQAQDSCGDSNIMSESLQWIVEYDNGTEVSVSSFTGSSISMETQAGSPGDLHTVTVTVTDGCNNSTSDSAEVSFSDEKAPVPLCVSGVTTAFMESDGNVSIWAVDFDLGSFDNCSDLQYSVVVSGETPIQPDEDDFSSQAKLDFSCDDLSQFYDLDVWVWDSSGNGDFCTVGVLIGGDCNGETNSGALISGSIKTEFDEPVEQVIVKLDTEGLSEFPKTYVTGNDGEYAFVSNPLGFNYKIEATQDADVLNGVSTLDLILLQKHIIGADFLDSPYLLIAGDANKDQKLSASDVLDIRQVILGLSETFSSERSWTFVNKSTGIFDQNNPWPYTDNVVYDNLNSNKLNSDLIGVKIGDLSGDVVPNSVYNAETRTTGVITLRVKDQIIQKGDQISVSFSSKEFKNIYGFQFTLEHQGLQYKQHTSEAIHLQSEHMAVHKEAISFSWNDIESKSATDLFTLEFTATSNGRLSEMIDIGSMITKSEMYRLDGLETYDIALEFDLEEELPIQLFQNDPNPFSDKTNVRFVLPKTADIDLSFYDVNGRIVKTFNGLYQAGEHNIIFDRKDLKVSGILYYLLKVGDYTSDTYKVVIVD